MFERLTEETFPVGILTFPFCLLGIVLLNCPFTSTMCSVCAEIKQKEKKNIKNKSKGKKNIKNKSKGKNFGNLKRVKDRISSEKAILFTQYF